MPLDDEKTHVILLEDDYYVTKDMLTSFKELDQVLNSSANSVYRTSIITLGNYDKVTNTVSATWKARQYQFDAIPFYGSQSNMGMALNRKTFDKLDSCAEDFCKYDDYNWDWSINSMIGPKKCLGDFRTLQFASPRVLHLGGCTGAGGTHLNKKGIKECNLPAIKATTDKFSREIYRSVEEKVRSGDDTKLRLRKDTKAARKPVKPNGGFSDPRDHKLCLNYNVVAGQSDHLL